MSVLKRSYYFVKRNFYTLTIPPATIALLLADYLRTQRYNEERERKRLLKEAREVAFNMRVNPKITFRYMFSELWFMLPLIPLYYIGSIVHEKEFQRWTKFKDRSALYGGMRAPGEEPSW